MLYVEISRARDRAELVIDDRTALKERFEAVTGERIAALEAVGPKRAKGHEDGLDVDRNGGRERGESASLDRDRSARREYEADRGAKGVDRELGL